MREWAVRLSDLDLWPPDLAMASQMMHTTGKRPH